MKLFDGYWAKGLCTARDTLDVNLQGRGFPLKYIAKFFTNQREQGKGAGGVIQF